MNLLIPFYQSQIEKYQKLRQTCQYPQAVERAIRCYEEELARLQPKEALCLAE